MPKSNTTAIKSSRLVRRECLWVLRNSETFSLYLFPFFCRRKRTFNFNRRSPLPSMCNLPRLKKVAQYPGKPYLLCRGRNPSGVPPHFLFYRMSNILPVPPSASSIDLIGGSSSLISPHPFVTRGESFLIACHKMQEKGHKTIIKQENRRLVQSH